MNIAINILHSKRREYQIEIKNITLRNKDSDSPAYEYRLNNIKVLENKINIIDKAISKLSEPTQMQFASKDNCVISGVDVSDLIEVNSAYISDAEQVGSYDVTGHVDRLWITSKEFDSIKCIDN